MGKPFNIRAPYTLKIGQMHVGNIGYVGGGNWRRTKAGFYTSADRWVLEEDETHIVMLEKTVHGLYCVPVPWMLNLIVEKVKDMPAHFIRAIPYPEEKP